MLAQAVVVCIEAPYQTLHAAISSGGPARPVGPEDAPRKKRKGPNRKRSGPRGRNACRFVDQPVLLSGSESRSLPSTFDSARSKALSATRSVNLPCFIMTASSSTEAAH